MTAEAMIRVRSATRDQVMRIAAEDYAGATADETLQRLIDEHWERKALDAMDRYRREDPDGYADYLRELADWDATAASPLDSWDDNPAVA